MKVLLISADNFEDSELLVPYYRFLEEGMQVDIASIRKGAIKGKHGYEVEANRTLEEINPADYDYLFLPGGKAPEAVRKEKKAQEIAKYFFEKKKTRLRNLPRPADAHHRGAAQGQARDLLQDRGHGNEGSGGSL